ncbi:hypothetical protein BH11PSE2_BH11PSE2_01010 [soil metagenome]
MSKNTAQLMAAIVVVAMAGGCDRLGRRDGRDPKTPSGFAVPRWVVLKFDSVNAHSGPSEDNRTLFTYKTKGLPVQVVAETKEWRRICDSDGQMSWVLSRMVDGRRNVLRAADSPLTLRHSPKAEAGVAAYLRPRALADYDRCDKGWCKVKAGDVAGWAPQTELWGVAEAAQCRAPVAAAAR